MRVLDARSSVSGEERIELVGQCGRCRKYTRLTEELNMVSRADDGEAGKRGEAEQAAEELRYILVQPPTDSGRVNVRRAPCESNLADRLSEGKAQREVETMIRGAGGEMTTEDQTTKRRANGEARLKSSTRRRWSTGKMCSPVAVTSVSPV